MRIKTVSLFLALGPACMAVPALSQTTSNATACGNEAQRLSDGFSLNNSSPANANTLSTQPGTRVDANMSAAQQQQANTLTRQAQTAAGRGNSTGCLQNLNQARSILRDSGVGPAPRSSSAPGTSTTGSSDTTSSASDRLRAAATAGQNPGTTNATPPTRNATRARTLNGSGGSRGSGGSTGSGGR